MECLEASHHPSFKMAHFQAQMVRYAQRVKEKSQSYIKIVLLNRAVEASGWV